MRGSSSLPEPAADREAEAAPVPPAPAQTAPLKAKYTVMPLPTAMHARRRSGMDGSGSGSGSSSYSRSSSSAALLSTSGLAPPHRTARAATVGSLSQRSMPSPPPPPLAAAASVSGDPVPPALAFKPCATSPLSSFALPWGLAPGRLTAAAMLRAAAAGEPGAAEAVASGNGVPPPSRHHGRAGSASLLRPVDPNVTSAGIRAAQAVSMIIPGSQLQAVRPSARTARAVDLKQGKQGEQGGQGQQGEQKQHSRAGSKSSIREGVHRRTSTQLLQQQSLSTSHEAHPFFSTASFEPSLATLAAAADAVSSKAALRFATGGVTPRVSLPASAAIPAFAAPAPPPKGWWGQFDLDRAPTFRFVNLRPPVESMSASSLGAFARPVTTAAPLPTAAAGGVRKRGITAPKARTPSAHHKSRVFLFCSEGFQRCSTQQRRSQRGGADALGVNGQPHDSAMTAAAVEESTEYVEYTARDGTHVRFRAAPASHATLWHAPPPQSVAPMGAIPPQAQVYEEEKTPLFTLRFQPPGSLPPWHTLLDDASYAPGGDVCPSSAIMLQVLQGELARLGNWGAGKQRGGGGNGGSAATMSGTEEGRLLRFALQSVSYALRHLGPNELGKLEWSMHHVGPTARGSLLVFVGSGSADTSAAGGHTSVVVSLPARPDSEIPTGFAKTADSEYVAAPVSASTPPSAWLLHHTQGYLVHLPQDVALDALVAAATRLDPLPPGLGEGVWDRVRGWKRRQQAQRARGQQQQRGPAGTTTAQGTEREQTWPWGGATTTDEGQTHRLKSQREPNHGHLVHSRSAPSHHPAAASWAHMLAPGGVVRIHGSAEVLRPSTAAAVAAVPTISPSASSYRASARNATVSPPPRAQFLQVRADERPSPTAARWDGDDPDPDGNLSPTAARAARLNGRDAQEAFDAVVHGQTRATVTTTGAAETVALSHATMLAQKGDPSSIQSARPAVVAATAFSSPTRGFEMDLAHRAGMMDNTRYMSERLIRMNPPHVASSPQLGVASAAMKPGRAGRAPMTVGDTWRVNDATRTVRVRVDRPDVGPGAETADTGGRIDAQ